MNINKLLHTIKYILNHPINKGNKLKAINRFLKWQINTKLNQFPVVYPFVENTKLILEKGGATGNLYCGLDEFEDMSFLLHFLRKGDIFVDIGANIGTYTLLASSVVGSNSISIEPLPATFERFLSNLMINRLENVSALNIGLGSQKGILKLTQSLDSMNHIALEGETDSIDVQIDMLDHVMITNCDKICLIKMDVEGFETEVINGGYETFKNPNIKALIIELNGSGLRYGYSEEKIHEKLLNFGFMPFEYAPFERILTAMNNFGHLNTIYIRDLEFVKNRLKSARRFKIVNKEF